MTDNGSTSDRPRVLVTGGAGYIGSHACEALSRGGYTPVVYDNLSHGFRALARFGPLEKGDIRDSRRLAEVIKTHRPTAVMHFAGLISVGESVADPSIYYDNNVSGALNLMDVMRNEGVSRMVFSSSAAVYGIPEVQPISETAPKAPINPYGRTKLIIEQALAEYDAAYGLRSVSLRYFNACGAHPSEPIGEMHEPETHLIPRALMAAQGKIPELPLNGTDYPTRDGTAIRDYIHVCDLAEAHVAAVRYLEAGGATEALNLGSGRGYSIQEIVQSVERVTGRPLKVAIGPRRSGDPAELVADPSRASEVLGFRTAWNDIDAIVATAWRWAELMVQPATS